MAQVLDGIKIRAFGIEDYDEVMALWEVCGLPSKPKGRDSREKIEIEITGDTADFLVAEKDNKVVGTVLATHDGRKGWINRLAVSPGFRHRGLAQRLLDEAEKALLARGLGIITCLIENDNPYSMDFFQEAGYRKCDWVTYFSKRMYPDV